VNVALIRDGRPVLGVVYVPVEQGLYYAAEGLGAWELGEVTAGDFEGTGRAERLPRDIRGPQGVLRVAASRSHLTPETQAFIDREGKGRKVELTPAGSSMKFCLVAEGSADLYPRFGPTMEWDTAAGQALVEQAGGSVVNAETGLPLSYNKPDLLNPYFVARGPKA
jgi:3'(2'), 5'-bisphosphate nucleotidase